MIELRPITDDEVPHFSRTITAGFGRDEPDDATDDHEGFRAVADLDATLAAFDGSTIVATLASLDLDLVVPGGSVPMAGTTAVTVVPTHRRRGLLRQMMHRHLRLALDRDQPLAGLWASEETIYRRFGYGIAADGLRMDLPASVVTVAEGPAEVTLRTVSSDEARGIVPPIHDRWVAGSPGGFRRSTAWWEWRHFADPPHRRDSGATSRRIAVAEREREPVGYAVYRQRPGWDSAPAGHVDIVELVALDDDARRALWHFLTNIDLFPNVHWWNAPADEPLRFEADRFRSISTYPIDTLWLRPLDVPGCLAARSYEADGSVVIDVTDSFLDRGGTFRVDVAEGVGSCEPAPDGVESDVTLDIADLGALYLGGRSARTLARAGRVQGSDAAVRTLHRLFAASVTPYCNEVF